MECDDTSPGSERHQPGSLFALPTFRATSPFRDGLGACATFAGCRHFGPQRTEAVMPDFSLPTILSFVTIIIVLVIACVLLMRARRSQAKRGETPGGIAGPSDPV